MCRGEKLNARPVFWLGYILLYTASTAVLGQLLSRGIITLPWLIAISVGVFAMGLFVAQCVVLPRLTRRPSPYPRITTADTWKSPLAPERALERIRDNLTGHGIELTSDANTVHARLGNDLTFRRRGTASEVGWQALPLAIMFRADAEGAGSRIQGEARDDFGWDFGPPQPFIEDEIRTRGTALLRRARTATE